MSEKKHYGDCPECGAPCEVIETSYIEEGHEVHFIEHEYSPKGAVWVKAQFGNYDTYPVANKDVFIKYDEYGPQKEVGDLQKLIELIEDGCLNVEWYDESGIATESPAEQPVKPYDELYRLVFSNLAKLRARTQDNERMINMADNIREIIEDVTNKMQAIPRPDRINDPWQLRQSAAKQPVPIPVEPDFITFIQNERNAITKEMLSDEWWLTIPAAKRVKFENVLIAYDQLVDRLKTAEQPGTEVEAIKFAEWLYNNRWFSFENGKWHYTFEQGTSISEKTYQNNYVKTTAQLLEIFNNK